MKLQDFRVGLRILAQDPVYSAVSIFGLAIALGVCLLLLNYARYCWHYNSQVPGADRVYIVKHRANLETGTPWYDQAPLFLLSAARTALGVEKAAAYVSWFPLTVEIDGRLRNVRSLTVLPDFAEMLGLRAIQGDLHAALSRPDGVAITQSEAKRLFGTSEVLGRTLDVRLSAVDENRSTAQIVAILPDPPANTTIPFEVLVGPNLSLIPPPMREELLGASEWMSYLLVRLQPRASPAAMSEFLQQAFDNAPSTKKISPEKKERLAGRHAREIRLAPLREAYFDREVTSNWLTLPVERGDKNSVAGLVAVAVLILALAAVNYINLATLRVVRRQREIATRKVLGVRNSRLALQFAAESLLVSMLATAAGFALACLGKPLFAELMHRDLTSMWSLENVSIALALGVTLGLLTAIYPAWIALGVRPSLMLMGRPDTESARSKRLRQALSVLQVSAAMALASFTLAIAWQAHFAMSASPGFDPSALWVFDLPTAVSAQDEKSRGFIAALSQRREIAGVATSSDPVGRAQELWSTEIKREGRDAIEVDVKTVSANFFEEYGIPPAAGRLLDPAQDKEADSTPIVLNALAARELGYASPELAVGQTLTFKSADSEGKPRLLTKRVVGIAPEIRFYSLREAPRAIAYQPRADAGPGWDGTLTVRAAGTLVDAERAIRETWPRYFPNSVVDVKPAREIYAANYADDARLASLLALSTGIALLIAAFGIYVLTADAVQRRTKEIALRKLFGTRRFDIGKLVAKEIGAVMLVSAIVALPVAAVAIARYLAPYTEYSPLAYWALAFAPLASLAIAAVAGARQTWIAMTLKPAAALRR